MRTILFGIIVIMLASGPAFAIARKAPSPDEQTCARLMGQMEPEGEGRSGAKFREQQLSDCLKRQQGK